MNVYLMNVHELLLVEQKCWQVEVEARRVTIEEVSIKLSMALYVPTDIVVEGD